MRAMASAAPFTKNPFTRLSDVKLLPPPAEIETHERRKPLRSYLAANTAGGGGGVDDLLGALRRGGGKKVTVERIRYRDRPEGTEDGGDEEGVPVLRGRRG